MQLCPYGSLTYFLIYSIWNGSYGRKMWRADSNISGTCTFPESQGTGYGGQTLESCLVPRLTNLTVCSGVILTSMEQESSLLPTWLFTVELSWPNMEQESSLESSLLAHLAVLSRFILAKLEQESSLESSLSPPLTVYSEVSWPVAKHGAQVHSGVQLVLRRVILAKYEAEVQSGVQPVSSPGSPQKIYRGQIGARVQSGVQPVSSPDSPQ